MKTTPEGEIAKMRVELDVTPWWWRESAVALSGSVVGTAMAAVVLAVPRTWRVTAARTYISVAANVTPADTLEGLEKKRTALVAKLDALVERKGTAS